MPVKGNCVEYLTIIVNYLHAIKTLHILIKKYILKLLETENKILKDDISTKQKLIDSLLQHNNLLLTQQERLTAELLTPTSENSCKSRKEDVIQMENNIRQEEMPTKSGISKANKLPLKKKSLKSNTTNTNQKSLFTIRN